MRRSPTPLEVELESAVPGWGLGWRIRIVALLLLAIPVAFEFATGFTAQQCVAGPVEEGSCTSTFTCEDRHTVRDTVWVNTGKNSHRCVREGEMLLHTPWWPDGVRFQTPFAFFPLSGLSLLGVIGISVVATAWDPAPPPVPGFERGGHLRR